MVGLSVGLIVVGCVLLFAWSRLRLRSSSAGATASAQLVTNVESDPSHGQAARRFRQWLPEQLQRHNISGHLRLGRPGSAERFTCLGILRQL